MTEKTSTEVTAGRVIYSEGHEKRLYTVTPVSQGDHTDLSATFEIIYYVRSWIQGTGVDAEVYIAGADFTTDDITFNNSAPALSYLEVIGIPIKSEGGVT